MPETDGTNSCAYLSLGIINQLLKKNSENYKYEIEDIITNFPNKFNCYRDITKLADIYEAYDVLSKNKLLDFEFDFNEKMVDSDSLYSVEFQRKFLGALTNLVDISKSRESLAFGIIHVGIYIFTIAVDKNGLLRVFETHPIAKELGGEGTGAIISSRFPNFIYEWLIKRFKFSKCDPNITPFLVFVTSEKK